MSYSITISAGKYRLTGEERSGMPESFTPHDFTLTEVEENIDGFGSVLSFLLGVDRFSGSGERLASFDVALGNEGGHAARYNSQISFFQAIVGVYKSKFSIRIGTGEGVCYDAICNSSNIMFSREELTSFPYYRLATLAKGEVLSKDCDDMHSYLPDGWFNMLRAINEMNCDFVIFSIS